MRTLICIFQPFNFVDMDMGDPRYGANIKRNPGSPGKPYEYLYAGSRDVKPGDWAIVHNGSEFGITKIERIKPGIGDKVLKHVISVVTQGDFEQYLEANKAIQSHREVFDQLDYLVAQDKKIDKYRELAARNPEAKELLDQLDVWKGPVIEAQSTAPVYDDTTDKPTFQEDLKDTVPTNIDDGASGD